MQTALHKADTNEALLVHIHDLLLCVVGLDVCLHKAKGNSMESCSELLARRVRDCSLELESLARRDDLLQQDVKQLLADLHSVVDEVKTDQGHFSRYTCLCLPSKTTKNLNSHQQIALHTIRTLFNGWMHNNDKLDFLQELGYELHDMRCFGVKPNDEIGTGSFARVFKASWLGLPVVLNCPVEKLGASDDLWYRFRHPFVIRTFGITDDRPHDRKEKTNTYDLSYPYPYVMELMSSDLAAEIDRRRGKTGMETEGPFPLVVAVDMMLQISRGMEYLHELAGVAHMDIKPANILVEACEAEELYSGEGLVRLKISDFGLSQEVWQTGTITDRMIKSDVYSFAITCSHILTGLAPFEGVRLNPAKMEQFITNGRERPPLPLNCPSALVHFIRRCWDNDPAKRPDFRVISNFLRHVKLVLMRVHDPKDFMSALTEFDRRHFEEHLKSSRFGPSEAEGYFRIIPPLGSGSEGSDSAAQGSVSETEEEKAEMEEISDFLSSVRDYKAEDELSSMPNFIWRMSFKDLSTATNDFSRKNRLGKGSFAEVYKGVLPNGKEVAVKRLNAGIKVFGTEAKASAKVRHPNVIRLLGLCDAENGSKLLVYDFMVRGSLENVLFCENSSSKLNWNQRCKIALGIAHGLAYLHEDCENCILHFDVKAGNVLLDHDLQPKLCDFGISELVDHTRKTFMSSGRRGTRGYMAPELNKLSDEEGKEITDSADVYSFGMLLFELVRGRPNFKKGSREQGIPNEARTVLDQGRVVQMMDPYLLSLPHQEIVRQQVEEVVRIAVTACEEHPESRPPMRSIVSWLTPFTL